MAKADKNKDPVGRMEWEHFPLDRSEKILSGQKNFRRLRDGRVSELAISFANGTFRENGDAIKFDRQGRLRDGQHRLMASLEAQVPFWSWVYYGLSDDSETTVDLGLQRRFTDWLHANGAKYYNLIASLVRLECGAAASGQDGVIALLANHTTVPMREMVAWYKKHRDSFDLFTADILSPYYSTQHAVLPSSLLWLLFQVWKTEPDFAKLFLSEYLDPTSTTKTSGAYWLRKLLDLHVAARSRTARRHRLTPVEIAARAIIAYNKWASGRAVSSIRHLIWIASGPKAMAWPVLCPAGTGSGDEDDVAAEAS